VAKKFLCINGPYYGSKLTQAEAIGYVLYHRSKKETYRLTLEKEVELPTSVLVYVYTTLCRMRDAEIREANARPETVLPSAPAVNLGAFRGE
jgi:hypothetical protein